MCIQSWEEGHWKCEKYRNHFTEVCLDHPEIYRSSGNEIPGEGGGAGISGSKKDCPTEIISNNWSECISSIWVKGRG